MTKIKDIKEKVAKSIVKKPKVEKQTPYGMFVRTWTTEDDPYSRGIANFVDAHLFNSNHGHVSFELRLPVNEKSEQLLKDYCSDTQPKYEKIYDEFGRLKYAGEYLGDENMISQRKELITNPDGSKTECYVVYFSWWLMQSDKVYPFAELHQVIKNYNKSKRLLKTPGYTGKKHADDKEVKKIKRYIHTANGGRYVEVSPDIVLKDEDNIPEGLKKYFELKLKKAEHNELLNSLDVLIRKLNKNLESGKPMKVNKSDRLLIQNTLGDKAFRLVSKDNTILLGNIYKLEDSAKDLFDGLKDEYKQVCEDKRNEKIKLLDRYDYKTNTLKDSSKITQLNERGIKIKEVLALRYAINALNDWSSLFNSGSPGDFDETTIYVPNRQHINAIARVIGYSELGKLKITHNGMNYIHGRELNRLFDGFSDSLTTLEKQLNVTSSSNDELESKLRLYREKFNKLNEKKLMQHRNGKQKFIEYGRKADHEVFLPISATEFGDELGVTGGIDAKGVLEEMSRLRNTEYYDFFNTNCCTTGRRILEAASGDQSLLKQLGQYKPFGAVDNPQLVHNAAELMNVNINGKLRKGFKWFPTHVSLVETLFGLIVNKFMQYSGSKSKKDLAKLIATGVIAAPVGLVAGVLASLFRPTHSLVESINLIKHFCHENDSKWFIKAGVLAIFVPRIVLVAIPAAIETSIKLTLFAISWPFVKTFKFLNKKLTKIAGKAESNTNGVEPKADNDDDLASVASSDLSSIADLVEDYSSDYRADDEVAEEDLYSDNSSIAEETEEDHDSDYSADDEETEEDYGSDYSAEEDNDLDESESVIVTPPTVECATIQPIRHITIAPKTYPAAAMIHPISSKKPVATIYQAKTSNQSELDLDSLFGGPAAPIEPSSQTTGVEPNISLDEIFGITAK